MEAQRGRLDERGVAWGRLAAQWPARRVVLALALVALEVLFWQQFVVALGMVVYGGFKLLGGGLRRLLGRGGSDEAPGRAGWRSTGVVYAALGVACFGINLFNLKVYGPWAFERVTTACRAHQLDHGRPPESLEALVPQYLSSVPPARLAVAWSRFDYWCDREGQCTVMWVILPPFMRSIYNVNEDRITHLD